MSPPATDAVVNLSSEKLLKRFGTTEIRCRPFHFRHSGLDLAGSILKIDKYELSFVPYTLSLSTCRLLVSMNEREIEHFNTLVEGTHTLKFTFDSEIWGRRVDFLLWGRIGPIHRANPDLDVALITFSISRVANTYREVFIDLALQEARLRELYDGELAQTVFDGDCYHDVFGTPTVIVKPGRKLARVFEVRSFSLRTMVLYGPVPPDRSVVEAYIKITLVDDRPPLTVDGQISAEEKSEESDAYRSITVDLDYNPDLVEIMSPFLKSRGWSPNELTTG